tara:strand:+ start:1237 stop:1770 length:534 start_codon:yes stop_codon:yes gene_type:complete
MKDYANRSSGNKRTKETKKTVFRSKKKSVQVFSIEMFGGLLIFSGVLVAVSVFYFGTDIETFKPRQGKNNVTINFPTSLMNNSVLIESNIDERFLDCEYFVQVGAYGNKKYAYEAKDALEEIKFITINDIYSSSDPGKLLHSVLSGPYKNRSAANNAKEKVTKRGFEPQLRTLCKKS